MRFLVFSFVIWRCLALHASEANTNNQGTFFVFIVDGQFLASGIEPYYHSTEVRAYILAANQLSVQNAHRGYLAPRLANVNETCDHHNVYKFYKIYKNLCTNERPPKIHMAFKIKNDHCNADLDMEDEINMASTVRYLRCLNKLAQDHPVSGIYSLVDEFDPCASDAEIECIFKDFTDALPKSLPAEAMHKTKKQCVIF